MEGRGRICTICGVVNDAVFLRAIIPIVSAEVLDVSISGSDTASPFNVEPLAIKGCPPPPHTGGTGSFLYTPLMCVLARCMGGGGGDGSC